MNRIKSLFAIVLLSASLGGCITFSELSTAFQLGTATITNPVTKTRLNQMESAVTIVFAGLGAWKKSCADGLLPESCKQQIAIVQVYTRQIPPYLTQLRTFVKTNDQVNATVVFNNLTSLIGTVKSQAATNGVNVGS
jgi:hypothetical protein